MSEWFASPFTGLFTESGPMPVRAHDPAFDVWGGTAAAWLRSRARIAASGIGRDAEGAGVGEAIERLQPAPLSSDQIVDATFAGWPLDEPAIDPAAWVLFHDQQYETPGFPFERLTSETKCRWVCTREALTGEPHWAPVDFVFLHHPQGHRFGPGYSTGLAAGCSGHPLVLRGVQEVIERDAIVGAWWRRYPLEEHPAADVFRRLGGDWAERCLRPNLTYRFDRIVNPWSDHVTLTTLAGEDREGPIFSIGSACRETRMASFEKSLLEAIHGRHYVRYLKGNTTMAAGTPTTFAEHAAYYSRHPERLDQTVLGRGAQTTASGGRKPPEGPHPSDDPQDLARDPVSRGADAPRSPSREEGLAELAARLGPARPILVRVMTPPALASHDLDWRVVRVVVPGLQPLHGNHDLAHLGGPLWSPRNLNDYRDVPPHPFP